MLNDTLAKNVITIEHSQMSTLTIVANANVNTHNLALMSTLTITLADSQHLMLSASHTLTPSSSQTLSISHPQTLKVEAETNNTNTQTTAQDTTHGTPMTQTILPLSLSLSLIVLVVSRVNCPLDERNERNQHSLHRAQPEFTKHWQNPNTFFLLFHWVR